MLVDIQGSKTGGRGDAATLKDKGETAVQLASYALELLSCTRGTHQYCLGMTVYDEAIALWYYDACGVVYTSEYISLIEHFEKFAAIIVGFAFLSPEEYGMLPAATFIPHEPYSRHFPPRDLEEYTIHPPKDAPEKWKAVSITLDEPIFTQYTLTGRRTFVYHVYSDPPIDSVTSKNVLKLSYQVSSRKSEETLVAHAKRMNVPHLPQIHMSADLWKMSDGIRDIFVDDRGKRLKYENRTLRAILYRPYRPIEPLLRENMELIPVMVSQMLDCESSHAPSTSCP